MDSAEEEKYVEFEKKVKRTVYLDNLSPKVTESVVKTAIGQFGDVLSVQFIPIYIDAKNMTHYALVEMENQTKAEHVIEMICTYPFMISGMPRPVRAFPAEIEMFDDRPRRPGRRIQCRWLDREDPDFEVAQKIKGVVRRHASEASFLLEQQLEVEEKLAKLQAATLKANHMKLALTEEVTDDKTVQKLSRHYGDKIPGLQD